MVLDLVKMLYFDYCLEFEVRATRHFEAGVGESLGRQRSTDETTVPGRISHLGLSNDDAATRRASVIEPWGIIVVASPLVCKALCRVFPCGVE